jgi:hypothetical protein
MRDPARNVSCQYDDSLAEVSRYVPLVTQTAGTQTEICTTTWASMMQKVGMATFGFRTQFFLNNVPNQTTGHTVDVHVNGVRACAGTNCRVPQTCVPAPAVACYDPGSNSVQFNPLQPPAAGDSVTVVYDTICY